MDTCVCFVLVSYEYKPLLFNLLFKHNVTIIDFIGAYTRAAWHNFASELLGT